MCSARRLTFQSGYQIQRINQFSLVAYYQRASSAVRRRARFFSWTDRITWEIFSNAILLGNGIFGCV